nr:U-box domain-containing protein 40 [Ipomoea batatas]
MHYWGKREARPPWLQRTGVSGSPRQDTARSSQCPKAHKVGKEACKNPKLRTHRSTFLRKHLTIPTEFLCPISRSLMADPVIVSSGHTFERHCVNACKSLCFTPVLHDGSAPDFSAVIPNLAPRAAGQRNIAIARVPAPDFSVVIPNLALKSAILNWCESSLLESPAPIDFLSAEKLVRALMGSQSRGTEKHSDCEGSCSGFSRRYPEFGAQVCYSELVWSLSLLESPAPIDFLSGGRSSCVR